MKRKGIRTIHWIAIAGIAYLALAYVLFPQMWIVDERGATDANPMVTRTPDNIPGDPINVGLVGDRPAILQAMARAGWDTADAVTLKSAVEIGISVLFDRPYPDAPVSPLIYEGRREDLAFEKPAGTSADRRHHVRFWQTTQADSNGKPLWLGAASFDKGVGVSHNTGQITHHIGPNVDAARDGLMDDLRAADMLASTYEIAGRGATQEGRNGGGDHYFTDGKALVGVLVAAE